MLCITPVVGDCFFFFPMVVYSYVTVKHVDRDFIFIIHTIGRMTMLHLSY